MPGRAWRSLGTLYPSSPAHGQRSYVVRDEDCAVSLQSVSLNRAGQETVPMCDTSRHAVLTPRGRGKLRTLDVTCTATLGRLSGGLNHSRRQCLERR